MVGKAVRIALVGCASVLALVVGRTAMAGEVTITFVRIVDTDTPVPFIGGATGEVTFDSLGAPTIDDGLAARRTPQSLLSRSGMNARPSIGTQRGKVPDRGRPRRGNCLSCHALTTLRPACDGRICLSRTGF